MPKSVLLKPCREVRRRTGWYVRLGKFARALCGARARRASVRIACMLVELNGGEDCSGTSTKFKVRRASYLYTLIMAVRVKAEALKQSLPPSLQKKEF